MILSGRQADNDLRFKGVKCDGGRPVCLQCRRAGLDCNGFVFSNQAIVPSPASTPPRGQIEGHMYHRFEQELAPMLASFYDRRFWLGAVLSAAQGNDEVFFASLALATLLDLSQKETLSVSERQISASISSRYHRAIDWYCKSVNRSIKSVPDEQSAGAVVVLLINSIIYFRIEVRQGNYDNGARLLRAAFAIIYSTRVTLWNSRDLDLLAVLASLIELPIRSAVSGSCISKLHWKHAIVLAMNVSADTVDSQLYRSHFQLANIMFVLDDLFSSQNEEPASRVSSNIAQQLEDWKEEFLSLWKNRMNTPAIAHRLGRMHLDLVQSEMRWNLYQTGGHMTTELGQPITKILDYYEGVRRATTANPQRFPRWAWEISLCASSIGMAWHWRDPSVSIRWARMLPDDRDVIPGRGRVLQYLHILATTPYGQRTALEETLFGKNEIKTLQRWQEQRCAQYLLSDTELPLMLSKEQTHLQAPD